MSSDASSADRELPPVDARLVAPGTRYEVDDGRLVHVPLAHEPHASRHSKVSALVETHASSEFDVASDMLTRTSETSDIAPDVSVFPRARDPRTGGRQLEALAFEIVSTESLGHAGSKAAKLIERGVRRVFAIHVEHARALEWSRGLGTWSVLDPTGRIDDPALAVPLPIQALVHAANADDAIARALLAKRNPVLEATRMRDRTAGLKEGREEGRIQATAQAVLVVLAARGLTPTPTEQQQIIRERDPARLERWLAASATCGTIAEVLGR